MLFKSKTVVVHNGEFHADDVFAAASLSLLLGKIKVIRTRDEKIIATGDYVADVGGMYDPSKNRFDHHQTGGAGKRANGVPYAAFGLVWKSYGEKIAGSKEAADMIDRRLVTPIDAIDNGTTISGMIIPEVRPYDISTIVGTMNPYWHEDQSKTDEVFLEAVEFAKKVLLREIQLVKGIINSKKAVLDIYTASPDKRLIVLDRDYDWEPVLQELSEPLYVVYQKEEGWRVKAVRKNLFTFENRKNLPAAWAGKRNGDLAALTGVPDAFFCHNMLFIASAGSKEGALKLARIALEA